MMMLMMGQMPQPTTCRPAPAPHPRLAVQCLSRKCLTFTCALPRGGPCQRQDSVTRIVRLARLANIHTHHPPIMQDAD